jgi:DNA-binding CsgD family transcriptional regulator
MARRVEIAQTLPRRQRQVLIGLGGCRSRKEIADELKISPATLDNHCRILYARLGIHSLAQAVLVAAQISQP